jgi:hypothetical protein
MNVSSFQLPVSRNGAEAFIWKLATGNWKLLSNPKGAT